MTSKKTKLIALSGLLSAMIFIVTLIHIPTGNGYTHAGDGVIYLTACILPAPYAVVSSAIGGLLADGLSGAAVWIPATIVIKSLTALCFSSKSKKIISVRNVLGIIPSFVLCFLGYSLYEAVFILNGFSWSVFLVALSQIWAYTIQVAASSALFIAVGLVLDKTDFKNKFLK